MVAKSSDDTPDLRNIYSFGVGDNRQPLGYSEEDPQFVGRFETDQQAAAYAEKEGFDSVSRLLIVLHYPITKEQGVQIAANLNKYNKESNALFDKLNKTCTPEQLEILCKLICYMFDKVV